MGRPICMWLLTGAGRRRGVCLSRRFQAVGRVFGVFVFFCGLVWWIAVPWWPLKVRGGDCGWGAGAALKGLWGSGRALCLATQRQRTLSVGGRWGLRGARCLGLMPGRLSSSSTWLVVHEPAGRSSIPLLRPRYNRSQCAPIGPLAGCGSC